MTRNDRRLSRQLLMLPLAWRKIRLRVRSMRQYEVRPVGQISQDLFIKGPRNADFHH